MRFYTLAALSAGLACAACASDPVAVNPTPTSVSYNYSGDQISTTSALANQYCSERGRVARLRNTSPQNGTSLATYDCYAAAVPVATTPAAASTTVTRRTSTTMTPNPEPGTLATTGSSASTVTTTTSSTPTVAVPTTTVAPSTTVP